MFILEWLNVLLIYLILAIGVIIIVAKNSKSKKAKWLSLLIMLLLPFADTLVGLIYFYSVCALEGGQEIYKTTEISKEYYTPNLVGAKLPDGQEMEVGKVYSMRINQTNYKVKLVPDQKKLSGRYEIVIAKFSNSKVLGVQKISSYVKDKQSNKLLGSATSFAYWGGWLANHSGAHVTASECPEQKMSSYEPSGHSTLLEKVFVSKDR